MTSDQKRERVYFYNSGASTGHTQNEKALGEMQTMCAGCNKAEQKNFAPPETPFPGVPDGQNLISWRRSMHAISSYRGNRPTNTRRPPATDRTDNNTVCH